MTNFAASLILKEMENTEEKKTTRTLGSGTRSKGEGVGEGSRQFKPPSPRNVLGSLSTCISSSC